MKKTIKLFLILLLIVSLSGCKKEKIYEVKFMDGEDVILTTSVKENNKAIQSSAPNKEGYCFDYWALDNEAYDFSLPVTSNLILQAVYYQAHLVTLKINSEIITMYARENEVLIYPQPDSTSELKYLGWYLDDELFDESTPITSDITLIAKFQKYTPALAINFTSEEVTIGTKQTLQLGYNVYPAETTDTISFSSDDDSIVSVNNKGVIKGLSIGSTYVRCVVNGNTDYIKVNVIQDVESIDAPNSITLKEQETYSLKASVLPSNSYNKQLTYTIADTKVATIDQNGLITAKMGGTTTLTIKAVNGISKTVTINVNQVELQLLVNGEPATSETILYFYNDKNNSNYTLTLNSIDYQDGKGSATAINLSDSNVKISSTVDLFAHDQNVVYMKSSVDKQTEATVTFTYYNQDISLKCVYEPDVEFTPSSRNITITDGKWYVAYAQYKTSLISNVDGTFTVDSDKPIRIDNFKAYSKSISFVYYTVNSQDDTIIKFVSNAGQSAYIYLYNAE